MNLEEGTGRMIKHPPGHQKARNWVSDKEEKDYAGQKMDEGFTLTTPTRSAWSDHRATCGVKAKLPRGTKRWLSELKEEAGLRVSEPPDSQQN